MEKILDICKEIIQSPYPALIARYLLLMIPIVIIHELGHIFAIGTVRELWVQEVEIGWGIPFKKVIKNKSGNNVHITLRLPFVIVGKTRCPVAYLEGNRWQNLKLLWVSIAGPLFQFILLVLTVYAGAMTTNLAVRDLLTDAVTINFLTLIVNLIPIKYFNTDGFKVLACLKYEFNRRGVLDNKSYAGGGHRYSMFD